MSKLKLFEDLPTNKPAAPVAKPALSYDSEDDDNEPSANGSALLEDLLRKATQLQTNKEIISKQKNKVKKAMSIVDKLITIQNVKKEVKQSYKKEKEKKEVKKEVKEAKKEAKTVKKEVIPVPAPVVEAVLDPIFGLPIKKNPNKITIFYQYEYKQIKIK
jgi:hypothetical protein